MKLSHQTATKPQARQAAFGLDVHTPRNGPGRFPLLTSILEFGYRHQIHQRKVICPSWSFPGADAKRTSCYRKGMDVRRQAAAFVNLSVEGESAGCGGLGGMQRC